MEDKKEKKSKQWGGVIQEYRDFLDVKSSKIVTLLEGNTPLIPSVALVKELSEMGFCGDIFFKHEGLNPTSSFKDRGMTVAVTKAYENKKRSIICASTGNTSASASAYGARIGLPTYVIVPAETIALGKLCQAMSHGAYAIKIRGSFDTALRLAEELAEMYNMEIVNSINPWRLEGQKTAAFEICDVLQDAPDYHFLPVGNAANIFAYWKGYKEYKWAKKITNLPKMMGFQAEGASPIVKGHPIENPQTIASAIRIGNPANWKKAELARDESGGVVDAVSDEEIIKAYRFMGAKEGVFCEPASAAGVAGLIRYVRMGYVKKGTVVCTITGHGLKDPDSALKFGREPKTVDANIDEIKKVIQLD